MADTATDVEHGHEAHSHDAHAHPTEKQYWLVFVMLVTFTALEVAWSYLGFKGLALVAPLLVMMVLKFMLVGGAFMHLYFDLKIINGRLFTWAFGGALLLALGVYCAVLATFRFAV